MTESDSDMNNRRRLAVRLVSVSTLILLVVFFFVLLTWPIIWPLLWVMLTTGGRWKKLIEIVTRGYYRNVCAWCGAPVSFSDVAVDQMSFFECATEGCPYRHIHIWPETVALTHYPKGATLRRMGWANPKDMTWMLEYKHRKPQRENVITKLAEWFEGRIISHL